MPNPVTSIKQNQNTRQTHTSNIPKLFKPPQILLTMSSYLSALIFLICFAVDTDIRESLVAQFQIALRIFFF